MKKFGILNANALKIIALVSMIIDHVGVMLFPSTLWLRCLGRISMPIFAYMIAEGCRHTKSIGKYFLRIFILGALCQVVYFVAYQSLYLSTLISFSLSVLTIALLKKLIHARKKGAFFFYSLLNLLMLGFMLFLLYPPQFMDAYGLVLDYGFYPYLIPIILYFLPAKGWRIAALIPLLYFLMQGLEWQQIFSFAALPILLLYNGERGKRNLKYLFYIAYPLHLVIIFIIYMFFFAK